MHLKGWICSFKIEIHPMRYNKIKKNNVSIHNVRCHRLRFVINAIIDQLTFISYIYLWHDGVDSEKSCMLKNYNAMQDLPEQFWILMSSNSIFNATLPLSPQIILKQAHV